MVKKILKTGMLALMLVFGLMVVGCDLFDSEDNSRIVSGVVATLIEGTTSNRDSVHVTWFAASGATHYEIAYKTNMDSLDTRRSVNSRISNTSFSHTNYIRNQGTLIYFVRAHGTSTNSDGTRTRWEGPWAMSSEVEVRP